MPKYNNDKAIKIIIHNNNFANELFPITFDKVFNKLFNNIINTTPFSFLTYYNNIKY